MTVTPSVILQALPSPSARLIGVMFKSTSYISNRGNILAREIHNLRQSTIL
jgi:hypothetical protein